MKVYKDLLVWQKSVKFVIEIYKITKLFPQDETYGLSSQMRRAAVSIPSNIAEGSSRNSSKEYKQFLSISLGSSSELDTQLIIANELNYINKQDFEVLTNSLLEIRKMLIGLIKSMES